MQLSAPHQRRFPAAVSCSLIFAFVVGIMFFQAAPAIADDEKPNSEQTVDDQDDKQADEEPYPFTRHFRVKSFDGGNGWLNTSGEITPEELRGKVVILDFWTYCCINCMHILPELKALEQKYPNQLVVIGVHSAKFENEKGTDNIREAIMRYEIEHPVVNDSDMKLWQRFFTRAWPTIGIIDPEGHFIGNMSGEFEHEQLDQAVIAPMIAYHRKKGTLDETPVDFHLEREKAAPTPLRYPGKLLADAANGRLYISDSNHNRIVITTLEGKLLEVIGSGRIGADDGNYTSASFDHPQGMALEGDTLYVADTENHLIRKVDLAQKTVSTLAGTGEQNRRRQLGAELKTTALNSPWALSFIDGKLYIAMAGPHQMWVLDEEAGTIMPYAGSGREDVTDGPLLEGAMAQPSGIATDGESLYVVDSEASAVRKIDLDPSGQIMTFVGKAGGGLFRFGDVDGIGEAVKLQHPLGIVYQAGKLYVADSYNHKIKVIDTKTRECRTLFGTGQPGDAADPPQFSEPAGLTIVGAKLYIADTNNHKIRVADLESGAVSDLAIAGLQPPTPPKKTVRRPKLKDVIKHPATTVRAEKKLRCQIELDLPEGYKLNKLAPVTYRVFAESDKSQEIIDAKSVNVRQEAKADQTTATFDVSLTGQTGSAGFILSLTYQFCRDGVGGLCKIRTVNWAIPLTVEQNADQQTLELKVPPAGSAN